MFSGNLQSKALNVTVDIGKAYTQTLETLKINR